MKSGRIYLSPPHMGSDELTLVQEAFTSNWVAPLGPHVTGFQYDFEQLIGTPNALALSSGTAALHLALQLIGVRRGDEVFVSTLTFAASANPVCYLGAKPVFIDSERRSWNMDPELLAEALEKKARIGRLPKAVVLVHLYGQTADLDPIVELCRRYGVPLIEDAAEALGATYKGRPAGTFGQAAIFSFNGNKIITSGGGGMLVSPDADLISRALKLATQARDPGAHYEHSQIGYNYRMSNVLAAIGRGQLNVLEDRVLARRRNFEFYKRELGRMPGFAFMPEAPWGRHNRWLTTLTIDPFVAGIDREAIRVALEAQNIEARPVWKPMHQQPVFADCEAFGGTVSDEIFEDGLCLPSGSALTEEELDRVCTVIRRACGARMYSYPSTMPARAGAIAASGHGAA